MKLQITTDAYQDIIKQIGSKTPEQGGILVGKDGVVTDFIYDKEAKTTGSTYTLNVEYLNPIIKEMKRLGKELLGITHSHPYGYSKLSPQDREYFLSQFKNFPNLEFMYTPIVYSAKQDEFQFFPYVFHKDGRIEEAELEILPNDYAEYIQKNNQPDPATVAKRKELLVFIRQNVPAPAIDRERFYIPKPVFIGMLLLNAYYFALGVGAGILPVAVYYIIKNYINL